MEDYYLSTEVLKRVQGRVHRAAAFAGRLNTHQTALTKLDKSGDGSSSTKRRAKLRRGQSMRVICQIAQVLRVLVLRLGQRSSTAEPA